jgi:hypothetical protein
MKAFRKIPALQSLFSRDRAMVATHDGCRFETQKRGNRNAGRGSDSNKATTLAQLLMSLGFFLTLPDEPFRT